MRRVAARPAHPVPASPPPQSKLYTETPIKPPQSIQNPLRLPPHPAVHVIQTPISRAASPAFHPRPNPKPTHDLRPSPTHQSYTMKMPAITILITHDPSPRTRRQRHRARPGAPSPLPRRAPRQKYPVENETEEQRRGCRWSTGRDVVYWTGWVLEEGERGD